MKSSLKLSLALVAALVLSTGCTDSMLTELPESTSSARISTSVPDAPTEGKLRFPHLLDQAMSGVASKSGQNVNLFLGFNQYEADGVTRRVLDEYGVTRRVLEEYGVTRRVLEEYGVTRRVLDEYGVTRRVLDAYGVTRRVLEEYGITRRVLQEYAVVTDDLLAQYGVAMADLEAQGVTRRVLDDYGVTRRVLDDYAVTMERWEGDMSAFENVIRLRFLVSKGRPGVTISFDSDFLNSILDELYFDSDISFIDPDVSMGRNPYGANGAESSGDELVSWNLQAVGGIFTSFHNDKVHVYVLDSGVQDYDMDLVEAKDFTMLFQNRGQEMIEESEILRVDGFDPGSGGDWTDGSGHGTHVAGIIAAKKNSSGVRGVARGMKLHSLKVLTDQGKTDMTTVMAAVDYVTGKKLADPSRPMVMNLSLGMDLGSGAYNALDEAVQDAISAGVVVVVSAGNDGKDATTYSPAHVRDAITVGAYDKDYGFADYSNYGPAVDILAPGTGVVSLSHKSAEFNRGDNVLMSGTSHAAPHVTGAAAVYLQLNPTATPAQVKAALQHNGRKLVLNAPNGTTNRTVYVSSFAGDGDDKPFAFSKAQLDNGTIRIEGEGERLSPVEVFSVATGELMQSFTVQSDHKWEGNIPLNGTPPCDVEARWNNEAQKLLVEDAEFNCDHPLAVDKATFTSHKKHGDQLSIQGTALRNATVELSDHASGEVFWTLQADGMGTWDVGKLEPPFLICAVRATSGQSVSILPVSGNRACRSGSTAAQFGLDQASFTTDEYGDTEYKVKGTAEPFAALEAYNALTGTLLGEFEADKNGRFQADWENPASVPCAIRVQDALSGISAESTVNGAPADCVGLFRLASA
ncbi:MAG: S8 family serine peptidase, partial [Rhodothermales bacterium]|nr:S8 family serine peptidase [Rhodothermales bacterium]